MKRTSNLDNVSTRLERIAELARSSPTMVIKTLAHHIDVELLRVAYRRTRKDGAAGSDHVTAAAYAANLETNLQGLLDRFKSGTYFAPPVRRVHLPKPDGDTRPIGIPTFEDKVLQRAVGMVLGAVYEQDFLPCSYGFRPKRSAHQALDALWDGLMAMSGGWVIEVDIRRFFDSVDHRYLRAILDQRVRDGVLRKMIDKWLKAGVLEGGALSYPDAGTPQGGVISPLLANVYLHEVVDVWFEREARPRLSGRAGLVPSADDLVMVFEHEHDARRVMAVLPKRFERYGLTLHPTKTRLLEFRRPPSDGPGPGGFEFLGFMHFWERSRTGAWVVKRKTASSRFRRALQRISIWCRRNLHQPIRTQYQALARKLIGHFGYFGIIGNSRALGRFKYEVQRIWRAWLRRRSAASRPKWTWRSFNALLVQMPLPPARVVHYRVANPVV